MRRKKVWNVNSRDADKKDRNAFSLIQFIVVQFIFFEKFYDQVVRFTGE